MVVVDVSVRRAAFTLFELTITMLLVVLVAGIAILSVQQPLANARRQRAISRIITLEQQERSRARASQSLGRIELSLSGQLEADLVQRSISLPSNLRVSRMIRWWPGNGFVEVESVPYAPSGQSPTFVVELSSGDVPHSWLAFLGISGKTVAFDRPEQLAQFVAVLQ